MEAVTCLAFAFPEKSWWVSLYPFGARLGVNQSAQFGDAEGNPGGKEQQRWGMEEVSEMTEDNTP